jgi:hypothetical protein
VLLTVVFATGAYIVVTYILLAYWGAAVGLPWAPKSWAFPVAGVLLTAGGLLWLYSRFARGTRKRMDSYASDSKDI